MDLGAILSHIEDGDSDEIERRLLQYNQEVCRLRLSLARLCQGLLTVLGRQVQPRCQKACLETLRILSRDKRVLAPVATREGMLVLGRLAGLESADEIGGGPEDVQVLVEALKCLCNIVFNSQEAQQVGADIQMARGLCRQLQMGRACWHEVELFSLRLIFLLSALRTDVRDSLRRELSAVSVLTRVLEDTLCVRWVGPYEVAAPSPMAPPLSAEATERTMEALKALFNLTLSSIHMLVLCPPARVSPLSLSGCSNAINLLSNITVSCLDVLIDVPVQDGQAQYEGRNMEAVWVLLKFMEKRIDRGANYKEGLTPVLSLLTESSRHHREIRKYIKAQVLPPLKDVKNRPEVGSTVRNKLVRLMTHVDTSVKQSAAEFLFVLCKESVDSLLKYTGYGNAAGLLAARGLLAGGRGEGQYSEDEDSDTDEYKSAKRFINPITGHIEEPMPNPVEDMTEEQKEYEAEKLASMFDQLSRQELIKPMGVRRDGTLAPLEETVSKCTVDSSSSDSD
uniref:Synembryn n=1 Tax=Paramormyrops kingsleyae TaxID=1676925 RepID=A0A3B3QUZ9_9TELE